MSLRRKYSSIVILCFLLLSCSAQSPQENLEAQSLSEEQILKTAVISGAFMQKNKDEIEKEDDKKKKRKTELQQETPGASSGDEGQNEIAN